MNLYPYESQSEIATENYAPNLVENIGSEENTTCYKLQINYILWQINFIYNMIIWRNSIFPKKLMIDGLFILLDCVRKFVKCCWKLKLKSVLHPHFDIL